jgi:hypothetical protein
MRWALALLVLLVVGAGTALALALHRSHDPVPERVATCVEDAGGRRIRGREGLAVARPDILARRLRVVRTYRLGRDRGALLRGRGYAVLVLRGRSNPPLGPDPARALYDDPSRFAYVGVERAPVRGVLDGCARRFGGR